MPFYTTQDGAQVWTHNVYSPAAVSGVSVLVVAAAVSLVAAVGLLAAILIASFKNGHAFIRSHLGAYFVSLILAEIVQAVGSLLSARWVALRQVDAFGTFCPTQAALKNAGNVSTALWSMIIAFHTFTLIFLKMRVPPWLFYTTLVFTWSLVGFIVLIGPAAIQTTTRGPFWGISGYWCWITEGYGVERFMMEYFFMFMTAGVSTVLYILIFFRMRGNIEVTGFHVAFRRTSVPWQRDTSMSDPQIARVGKRMLWYPVAYVILILPIAACRWSEVFGKNVPFSVTIFADTIFLLSGLVNAILYSTTRSVPPIKTIIPTYKSRKTVNESFEAKDTRSSHTTGKEDTFTRPLVKVTNEIMDPRALEEARGLPYLAKNSQDGNKAPPKRSISRGSSRGSIEDAGYPGPVVEHAAAPSSLPIPALSSRPTLSGHGTQSNRNALEKDWI